jgi:hypothetical protein
MPADGRGFRVNTWNHRQEFDAITWTEEPMSDQAILWRLLDQPGHESARLSFLGPNWHLMGTAVFLHQQEPCRLDYLVICDSAWQTVSGRVSGWIGAQSIQVELSVASTRRWRLNGIECPDVVGCVDLDLNFSRSTNLLPIRRLKLAVGHEAEVKAAWLRFPSFSLEPLPQTYRRLGVATYQYESGGGTFVRDLTVNAIGFVTAYPDFGVLEAAQERS